MGLNIFKQQGQPWQENIERDHEGNYYVNGQKTALKVFNPDAVPYVKDEPQTGAASNPVLPPKGTNQNNGSIKVTDNPPMQSATETGGGSKTTPETRGADYLSSLLTTPQQEEEYRKQSVQRQRIAAVGDVLRHIGNLYFATQGATPMKFNSPVEEERKRYLQEKAIRDKNNYQYMTYQQAKAAQEARIAQMQAQNQLRADLNAAQVQNYKDRAEEYARHNKAIEEFNKSKAETAAQNAQRAYEHKVETDNRRTDIMQQRVNKSGGGGRSSRSGGAGGSRTGGYRQTTRYTYNDKGVRTGSVVEKTPTGTFDQQNGRRSLLPGGNARGGSLLPK